MSNSSIQSSTSVTMWLLKFYLISLISFSQSAHEDVSKMSDENGSILLMIILFIEQE